jgi:hypothetical protein
VVKPLPGQTAIQNGNAPITVMTDRTLILEAPITKAAGQTSSQGNLALVSLTSNVQVSGAAMTLLPGNPTLSSIATNGLPDGVTAGTPTFQIDAAVVALNGSLTMPFVECPSGSNCPRPLGELAVNGALMQKTFAPMNAVNTDTNQIVSGVTKLSLNFNDGFVRPGGVMPGFSQADVSSLNASLVGAVEVNFVERGMAEIWFGLNPTTTVASNIQTTTTDTRNTNVTTTTTAQ